MELARPQLINRLGAHLVRARYYTFIIQLVAPGCNQVSNVKETLYDIPYCWLVSRDPYNGLLSSPTIQSLIYSKQPGSLGHCSDVTGMSSRLFCKSNAFKYRAEAIDETTVQLDLGWSTYVASVLIQTQTDLSWVSILHDKNDTTLESQKMPVFSSTHLNPPIRITTFKQLWERGRERERFKKHLSIVKQTIP